MSVAVQRFSNYTVVGNPWKETVHVQKAVVDWVMSSHCCLKAVGVCKLRVILTADVNDFYTPALLISLQYNQR